ncbi:MAG: glutamate 5-kinase [Longimicrobiales bacterium]|jgi:glutamate 5-kinase|nr:glutamate 5-kinase [Longimicrobiales bacterium]
MNNSSRSTVVLKFGSRLLTNGTAELDTERMATVARAVAASGDRDVVIVSSGAVAAGFRALGHATPPTRIADRQAAAAVGQGRLMKLWSDAFHGVGLSVGQVLLTNDGLTDRKRYVAARRALRALLQAGVVPIVNENDTVSVDEIVVGDNDNLAAMTAALVDADLLALLTDVPGVYDRDPDEDPRARVVTRASSAEELRALCFGKKEIVSTGGMETKLEAAERAGRYGVPTVIAAGADPSVIDAVLQGKAVGTRIEPHAQPLGARRHWMAVQKGLTGWLVIDDGAVRALRRRASLLPRGVIGVGGRFRRGDLVAVVDGQGVEQARGIVRFDDRDVERIRGMHTDEVKIVLGMETGTVVMRPDRMVLAREEVPA